MLVLRYVAGRIVQAVPVLIGVSLVTFLAIQFVPGDPIRIMMHGRISEADLARIHAELGMDRPLLIQYLDFVWSAFLGDLGTSIIQKAPVAAIVGERIGPSLFLLAYSTLLAVAIAVPVSLVAVHRRNTVVDNGIQTLAMVGFAMPPFWVGLLLILVFGLHLGWFPISGYGEGFLGHLRHLFLPSLTIALFLAPIIIQSLRSAMLDTLTADHIEVARSKGLSERRILLKHVLRNALIPVITVLAVNISWLVSGAVVVEYVFSLPGMGSLLVRSVGFRDYPVIQGLSLIFALIVVAINLLADVAYLLVDRRVAARRA
jgi:peptide/nickel transport system permease protein